MGGCQLQQRPTEPTTWTACVGRSVREWVSSGSACTLACVIGSDLEGSSHDSQTMTKRSESLIRVMGRVERSTLELGRQQHSPPHSQHSPPPPTTHTHYCSTILAGRRLVSMHVYTCSPLCRHTQTSSIAFICMSTPHILCVLRHHTLTRAEAPPVKQAYVRVPTRHRQQVWVLLVDGQPLALNQTTMGTCTHRH